MLLLRCALALCAALQAGLVLGQLPQEFINGSTAIKQKSKWSPESSARRVTGKQLSRLPGIARVGAGSWPPG